MALKLSSQLNKLITRCDVSKNTIIKDTGVDRSTFYQILSDKRVPTESVFSSLLHYFLCFHEQNPDQITRHDLDLLMRSYLNETLSSKELNAWKISSSFIQKASSILSKGTTPVLSNPDNPSDQKVFDFLIRQLHIQDGRLDFYLPTDLIRRFHIPDFLCQSIPYNSHINQLCGIYESRHQKISERLLDAMADCIGFLNCRPENYNVYCFSDSVVGKQNQLYPYYLIGKKEALFISADGNRLLYMEQEDNMEELHQYVNDIIAASCPLFTHVDNYMELARNLLTSYHTGEASVIYSIAERPCFWEMVTPEIISRYAPDKNTERFALEYASVLKSLPDFYGLNAYDGVNEFRKDHYISEAGLNLKLDETDMRQLHDNFKNTLWHHIILLPFSNCFIHNWEIAIYYPDTVYFSVYDDPHSVLCLKDHNVIEPLFTYYNTMFRVLHKDQTK